MSLHPPPPTPRRSTRVRSAASKPSGPLSDPSASRTNEVESLQLTNLKLAAPNIPSKGRKTRPAVSNRKDTTHKTQVPGSSVDSNQAQTVERLTQQIQNISIGSSSLPCEKPCEKLPSSKFSTQSPLLEPKHVVPLSEKTNSAMKTVNLNLAKLSSIRQTGWKAPATFAEPSHWDSKIRAKEVGNDARDSQFEQALDAIDQAYSAIQTLRKLVSNNDLGSRSFDTERAGLALVNHAIELGLYNSALRILEVAHDHLQALLLSPTLNSMILDTPKSIRPSPIAPTSWQSFSKVMTFTAPKSLDQDVETIPNRNKVAIIILTALAQGFLAFLNGNNGTILSPSRVSTSSTTSSLLKENSSIVQVRADCCLRAFDSSKALVQWVLSLSDHSHSPPDPESGLVKKILGPVQACYSAIVKHCSGWEDLLVRHFVIADLSGRPGATAA